MLRMLATHLMGFPIRSAQAATERVRQRDGTAKSIKAACLTNAVLVGWLFQHCKLSLLLLVH